MTSVRNHVTSQQILTVEVNISDASRKCTFRNPAGTPTTLTEFFSSSQHFQDRFHTVHSLLFTNRPNIRR